MKTTTAHRPKRPRDINQLAALTLALAIGEEQEPVTGKNEKAAELGSAGGLKGGRARADAMTPERRAEIAIKAAAARWPKQSSGEPGSASGNIRKVRLVPRADN